ncbi:OLC1v1023340C1 [Oldenlandia corymbosa var. corymbosa]|uniref:OLC1v1023340C1 n=1 Tax=Oldenlandia corymbosa var. corymbosa TaxID=529605 RepID=A0AAV1BZS6_OLDCO|nr:OLC1v1023340C1 [Oldenlandia corymbosa var. corymbosa]
MAIMTEEVEEKTMENDHLSNDNVVASGGGGGGDHIFSDLSSLSCSIDLSSFSVHEGAEEHCMTTSPAVEQSPMTTMMDPIIVASGGGGGGDHIFSDLSSLSCSIDLSCLSVHAGAEEYCMTTSPAVEQPPMTTMMDPIIDWDSFWNQPFDLDTPSISYSNNYQTLCLDDFGIDYYWSPLPGFMQVQ